MATRHHSFATCPANSRPWVVLGLLVLAGLLSVASASERKPYCVRRSALVPTPAPALRSAEPAQGLAEMSVANDTVTHLWAPRRLEGSNVGLYVPRDQLGLQILLSAHRIFSIGLSGELGMSHGAVPVAPGLIPAPSKHIGGGGLSFAFHIPVTRRVTIDLGCDLWAYSIRSRVAWFQADDCGATPPVSSWSQKEVTTPIILGRVQLGLGVDLGWSHLTLGGGIRNQPHNTDETQEWHTSPANIQPEIAQEIYPYIFALWDVRATSWLRVGVSLYQPLAFDPVIYAPVVGIQLRVIVPKLNRGRPAGDVPIEAHPAPPSLPGSMDSLPPLPPPPPPLPLAP